MAGIGKNWNGRVYGTNTGNVAVTFEGEDSALTGVIRLNDDRLGVAVYKATGKFETGNLLLVAVADGPPAEGMVHGKLSINGALADGGELVGEWSSSLGTGGTFQLWPHAYTAKNADAASAPEQLNTSVRSLGAVRLYAADVRTLLAQLVRDFSQKRAVVTFQDKGSERKIFADEFEVLLDDLPELKYLKISIQEPEVHGINRNATLELTAWGENTIRVQSVHESWAIGKAEALSRYAQAFQRRVATQFRKFGLTVNIVITVTSLAALPGLPTFWQRLVFAGSAFSVQALIAYFHRRYVPNFLLYPTKQKPSIVGRFAPGLISWAITIFGGVVAAVIYGLLKGELGDSPLEKLIMYLHL